jgi:hypothetical protein
MDRSTGEGDSNDCSGKHGHVLTLPNVRKPIGMNVDVMAPMAQRSKIQKLLETLEIIDHLAAWFQRTNNKEAFILANKKSLL